MCVCECVCVCVCLCVSVCVCVCVCVWDLRTSKGSVTFHVLVICEITIKKKAGGSSSPWGLLPMKTPPGRGENVPACNL